MAIERKKISDLTPDNANANKGTERGLRALDDSLASVGLGRSIVTDKHGRIIAGNKTTERALDRGFEDAIVVRTDGKQLVVVQRDDLDLHDDNPNNPARRLAYYDNRVAELDLDWNAEQILADVSAGMDFDGLFHDNEIDEIIGSISADFDVPKDVKPNPRNLPIDIIFTLSNWKDAYVPMALSSGWKWGIQSNKSHLKDNPIYEVTFIDNDYWTYDHTTHSAVVQKFRPKYATVMDIMTPAQCAKDNIKHYSLEQILEWAEEIDQYADNVIVIPKYDCLDKIPDKFMLGYSVPTSHGGTPLPPEMFRDRRVHLLGGSWKAQLAHMAVLGDDVVSMDNNYINKIASMGEYVNRDGSRPGQISQFGITCRSNPRIIALAITLGNIADMVNELYGGQNGDTV